MQRGKKWETLFEGEVTTELDGRGTANIQLLNVDSGLTSKAFSVGDTIRYTVDGVSYVSTATEVDVGVKNCYSYCVGNQYLGYTDLADDGGEYMVDASNNIFGRHFLYFYSRSAGTYNVKIERAVI